MHSALLERTFSITTAKYQEIYSFCILYRFVFSLYMWIFLSCCSHSTFLFATWEHCTLCLPPTLHCLWTHSERERESELCVLFGRSGCFSSLLSHYRTLGMLQRPHSAALSQFGHETNTVYSYTSVCRLFRSPSYSYLSISPLETFVTVLALDAVLCWCDWWHVEWSQLVPLTHICFFPPPLRSRYHGLLNTNSAGITIVSAFYNVYGQFDWSQLSYQALQQSPIREDPLSPRRW